MGKEGSLLCEKLGTRGYSGVPVPISAATSPLRVLTGSHVLILATYQVTVIFVTTILLRRNCCYFFSSVYAFCFHHSYYIGNQHTLFLKLYIGCIANSHCAAGPVAPGKYNFSWLLPMFESTYSSYRLSMYILMPSSQLSFILIFF